MYIHDTGVLPTTLRREVLHVHLLLPDTDILRMEMEWILNCTIPDYGVLNMWLPLSLL